MFVQHRSYVNEILRSLIREITINIQAKRDYWVWRTGMKVKFSFRTAWESTRTEYTEVD